MAPNQTKPRTIWRTGLDQPNLIRACRYCVNLWCNHAITFLFLTNWAVPSWKQQYDRDQFLATPGLNIAKLTEQDVTWAVTRAVYPAVQYRYLFEHFQLHRLQKVEQQDKPRTVRWQGCWGKRSKTISRHFYPAGSASICFSEMLVIYLRCHRLEVQGVFIVKTSNLTQSANQHMHTFNFLFIKTYLKFLKTLLHVSVIRPSSGSL